MLSEFQSLILLLYSQSKLTIAAINGFVTGAGLDLAFACDFRVASESEKLAEAYIGMGLVPDGGVSFFLPRFTMEIVVGETLIQLIPSNGMDVESFLRFSAPVA